VGKGFKDGVTYVMRVNELMKKFGFIKVINEQGGLSELVAEVAH
jgi:hypothetical protein